MHDTEERWRYRVTHHDVYKGITQKGALAMIMDEYPEFSECAKNSFEHGDDLVNFLSILDSFY